MGKGYTKAQAKATAKYMEGRKTIRVVVTDDEHAAIKAYSEKHGESMNAFIKNLVMKTIKYKKPETEYKNDIFGIIPNYTGSAVYSLVDDCGKKYIGSTSNLKRRINFYSSCIKRLLHDGADGFLCAKMQKAILEGRTFRLEVLEMFPDGISEEELNNKECFYLEQEGGLEKTYNMKPIKLKCQPGDILEHVETMERDKGE